MIFKLKLTISIWKIHLKWAKLEKRSTEFNILAFLQKAIPMPGYSNKMISFL